jgi:hypothetical protein
MGMRAKVADQASLVDLEIKFLILSQTETMDERMGHEAVDTGDLLDTF